MTLSRRSLLSSALLQASTLAVGSSLIACAAPAPRLRPIDTPFGALGAPDADGVRVLPGFTARRLATSGAPLVRGGTPWHAAPDGACCVPRDGGGWSYVSNAERESPDGGVGALDFDAAGEPIAIRTLLTGAARPCAGGLLANGHWLACEEVPDGGVWDVDPTGVIPSRRHTALGIFNHEAAALDPTSGAIYLTEDERHGGLYRFLPRHAGALDHGELQVLCGSVDAPVWRAVPDVLARTTPTREQHAGMLRFAGGEGAWFAEGTLAFTTKGDHRLWEYAPAANRLRVLYDGQAQADAPLRGVDNLIRDARGLHYVAEDGGDMQVCVVNAAGRASVLAQLLGVSGSEITGLAFAPDGQRLYFSSQSNPGATYELRGPFASLA